jgi:hypothetical protein
VRDWRNEHIWTTLRQSAGSRDRDGHKNQEANSAQRESAEHLRPPLKHLRDRIHRRPNLGKKPGGRSLAVILSKAEASYFIAEYASAPSKVCLGASLRSWSTKSACQQKIVAPSTEFSILPYGLKPMVWRGLSGESHAARSAL